MKLAKLFFLAFYCFLGISAVVEAAETHCICQTGLEPAVQKRFFQWGCQMWLNEQRDCQDKKIIESPVNMTKGYGTYDLNGTHSGDTVKLGYVGHWPDAGASALYLAFWIRPTAEKYDVDMIIDNTACSGLDDPRILQTFNEEGVLGKKRAIQYKANQAVSVGLWDRLLPGKSFNFWAVMNFPSGDLDFPRCTEFENLPCLGQFQKFQTGTCLDSKSEHRNLRCCPVKQSPYRNYDKNSWRWTDDSECSKENK